VNVVNLEKMAPRVTLVHQACRGLLAKMVLRVTGAILVPWVVLVFAAKLGTRVSAEPREIQVTLGLMVPRAMSDFVVHVEMLALWANRARVVKMASGGPLVVVVAVAVRATLVRLDLRVQLATRASRVPVVSVVLPAFSVSRVRRVSVVLVATRVRWE
jgi:hypothetical protein